MTQQASTKPNPKPPKRRRRKFSRHVKNVFLKNYAQTGRMIDSCKTCGMSHSAVKTHLLNDQEFAAEFEAAKLQFHETLEAEVKARAVDGWKEPVFYKGEECGYITKKSDRLLELLAKRHIKEYRQPHQIINAPTATVNVHIKELEEIPKEARGLLRELMKMMVQPKPDEKPAALEGEFQEIISE